MTLDVYLHCKASWSCAVWMGIRLTITGLWCLRIYPGSLSAMRLDLGGPVRQTLLLELTDVISHDLVDPCHNFPDITDLWTKLRGVTSSVPPRKEDQHGVTNRSLLHITLIATLVLKGLALKQKDYRKPSKRTSKSRVRWEKATGELQFMEGQL